MAFSGMFFARERTFLYNKSLSPKCFIWVNKSKAMNKEMKHFEDALQEYTTISLDQLNASMSFLERIDTKYLIDLTQLDKILSALQDRFYVLTIKDVNIFTYDSIYMDTKDYLFYKQHEQGEENRIKVRTRHYVDSGDLAYFEMKQKEGKVIRKFRYPCGVEGHGVMNKDAKRFYTSLCQSMGLPFAKEEIMPAIKTKCKRITLCSKTNDERLTIDFDVELNDLRDPSARTVKLSNVAIVESKSSSTSGYSHKLMKKMKIKAASGCSKYCLGVYYFGRMKSHDKFEKTIKFIDKHHHKEISTVEKVQQKLLQVKEEIARVPHTKQF